MEIDQEPLWNGPKLQLDGKGYTKSFSIDEFNQQEVLQFYNKYGIVVFNNVLKEQEIEQTIDELWTDIQTRCGKQNDRHDPSTWKFDGWRGSFGFVNGQPLNYLQVCKNRQNPKVYKAFKTLYELSSGKELKQPLLAMFDRGSGMRPTKNHPEWITSDIYHFDIKPWWWTNLVKTNRKDWRRNGDYQPKKFAKWLSQGNNLPNIGYPKLAGVLALTDTNQSSGGFEAACGFQHYIKQWCQTHELDYPIQKDQNLMANFQKLYQRKGSLVIFTRQLPHNIYKNLSQSWRFAQYLRMSPESTFMLTPFQKEKRRQCVLQFLPKDLPVQDPISQQIYMLK